jgi:hypothetical protein
MADINTLWSSQIVACDCTNLSGVNGFPQCTGNGWTIYSPTEVGYVFFDPSLLQSSALQTGRYLPAAVILAHETGHQLQMYANLQFPDLRGRELGADCLAGYFVAWAECARGANVQDLVAAFEQACMAGQQATGYPWFDVQTHGTCSQRVAAMQQGIAAFGTPTPPHLACSGPAFY